MLMLLTVDAINNVTVYICVLFRVFLLCIGIVFTDVLGCVGISRIQNADYI